MAHFIVYRYNKNILSGEKTRIAQILILHSRKLHDKLVDGVRKEAKEKQELKANTSDMLQEMNFWRKMIAKTQNRKKPEIKIKNEKILSEEVEAKKESLERLKGTGNSDMYNWKIPINNNNRKEEIKDGNIVIGEEGKHVKGVSIRIGKENNNKVYRKEYGERAEKESESMGGGLGRDNERIINKGDMIIRERRESEGRMKMNNKIVRKDIDMDRKKVEVRNEAKVSYREGGHKEKGEEGALMMDRLQVRQKNDIAGLIKKKEKIEKNIDIKEDRKERLIDRSFLLDNKRNIEEREKEGVREGLVIANKNAVRDRRERGKVVTGQTEVGLEKQDEKRGKDKIIGVNKDSVNGSGKERVNKKEIIERKEVVKEQMVGRYEEKEIKITGIGQNNNGMREWMTLLNKDSLEIREKGREEKENRVERKKRDKREKNTKEITGQNNQGIGEWMTLLHKDTLEEKEKIDGREKREEKVRREREDTREWTTSMFEQDKKLERKDNKNNITNGPMVLSKNEAKDRYKLNNKTIGGIETEKLRAADDWSTILKQAKASKWPMDNKKKEVNRTKGKSDIWPMVMKKEGKGGEIGSIFGPSDNGSDKKMDMEELNLNAILDSIQAMSGTPKPIKSQPNDREWTHVLSQLKGKPTTNEELNKIESNRVGLDKKHSNNPIAKTSSQPRLNIFDEEVVPEESANELQKKQEAAMSSFKKDYETEIKAVDSLADIMKPRLNHFLQYEPKTEEERWTRNAHYTEVYNAAPAPLEGIPKTDWRYTYLKQAAHALALNPTIAISAKREMLNTIKSLPAGKAHKLTT